LQIFQFRRLVSGLSGPNVAKFERMWCSLFVVLFTADWPFFTADCGRACLPLLSQHGTSVPRLMGLKPRP